MRGSSVRRPARTPRVAREPLLVVALGRVARRELGPAPGEPVTRAADVRLRRVLAIPEPRRQQGDQPHAVRGVVRDDWVAHAVGEPLEEAAVPRPARIGGGRPSDPCRTAVDEPAGLERGHDRRAEREAVRLDLRLVLCADVERVARQLARDDLAVVVDVVVQLGDDDVRPGPHSTRSAAPSAWTATVGPVLREDHVSAGTAVEQVSAACALEPVVPAAAADRVDLPRSDQPVRTGPCPPARPRARRRSPRPRRARRASTRRARREPAPCRTA